MSETRTPGGNREWEEHADWWRASFTAGRDPEYEEQILPLVRELVAPRPGQIVLDAGCGEGQVGRMLSAAGATVVGCDASAAQMGVAGERSDPRAGPVLLLTRGAVEALPVRDGVVDAVVVVLVLEHVADLDVAISEIARVTRVGGRAVVVLNHPLFQTPESGWIDDRILGESYWRVGPYLLEQTTQEEVDAGVRLTFHHRPLSRYVAAFVQSGLVIEELLEPPPPPGFLSLAPEYAQSCDIPRVLVLVARRAGTEK
ncbi:MAG: methyltransferase domain-containing protein [Acidimicrobiia bacterium]|nr:methyltransferase domain-containing protein [Acidimicrobiia bacterium]